MHLNVPKFNAFNALRERLLVEQGQHVLDAFEMRAKEYAAEAKIPIQSARSKIAKEFGYIDAKDERRRFDNRHRVSSREYEQHDKAVEEADRAVKEAMKGLPVTALPVEEADWIRGHPAMMRQSRTRTGKLLLVTAEDITDAPHGPPPSQSAVISLQSWINRPDEFAKWYASTFAKTLQARAEAAEARIVRDQAGEPETMAIDEALAILRGFSVEACELARQAVGR
jgi:hypothetical protein